MIEVNIQVCPGKIISTSVLPQTTLDVMLRQFDSEQKLASSSTSTLHFAEYKGVPPKESFGPGSQSGNGLFEIQINIEGQMKPVLSLLDFLSGDSITHNLNSTDKDTDKVLDSRKVDFSSVTVEEAVKMLSGCETGVKGLSFTLTHEYVAPTMSAQEQRDIVKNTTQRMGFTSDKVSQKDQGKSSVTTASAPLYASSKTPQSVAVSDLRARERAELTEAVLGTPVLKVSRKALVDADAFAAMLKRKREEERERVEREREERESERKSDGQCEGERERENEGAGKGEGERGSYVEPVIREDEVEDSEDDAFYEMNEGDIKVMAKMYVKKNSVGEIVGAGVGGNSVGSVGNISSAGSAGNVQSEKEKSEAKALALRNRLLGKGKKTGISTGISSNKTTTSTSISTSTTTSTSTSIVPTLPVKKINIRFRLPALNIINSVNTVNTSKGEGESESGVNGESLTCVLTASVRSTDTVGDLYELVDRVLGSNWTTKSQIETVKTQLTPGLEGDCEGNGEGYSGRRLLTRDRESENETDRDRDSHMGDSSLSDFNSTMDSIYLSVQPHSLARYPFSLHLTRPPIRLNQRSQCVRDVDQLVPSGVVVVEWLDGEERVRVWEREGEQGVERVREIFGGDHLKLVVE